MVNQIVSVVSSYVTEDECILGYDASTDGTGGGMSGSKIRPKKKNVILANHRHGPWSLYHMNHVKLNGAACTKVSSSYMVDSNVKT